MPPKPQPGEGIVVVVDVGPKTRLGLPIEQTFFSQAKTCLVNILQRKIFAEKCRDKVAVVLFGTDETNNHFAAPGQYEHISVMQDLQLVDWGSVSKAQNLPRGSHDGDWLDALVIAMDLLHDETGVGFSSKKIVLISDFSSDFSDNQVQSIISGIKSLKIDLSVIGPDMTEDETPDCDRGDGGAGPSKGCASRGDGLSWSGKVKTDVQLAGEALVSTIIAEVDGILCSFEDAIPQLIFFQKKSVGSSNWNTLLEIGPDFQIPVTGRIKIKRVTPNTWARCHATDETAAIIKERSYHKLDEEQTQVEDENIIDGYRYGSTLVPFSAEDQQMSYSSGAESAQLTVLGFTRTEHCPLDIRAGDQVLIVTAKEGDDDAAVALSAIIQALAQLNMVGICRRVYRRGLNPVMGALYPHISDRNEYLIWVALPFQEDVRPLMFPSLRHHMEAVTSDQLSVIDELIDGMNLCQKDEDGMVEDIMDPCAVLNPHLQHLYNCLTARALNPHNPLPAPHQHVTNILSVPDEFQQVLSDLESKLVALFPTTKIVKRTKRLRDNIFDKDGAEGNSKRSKGDDDSSEDEDDVNGALSVGGRVTQVTTATPQQDFVTLIKAQPQNFLSICDQLSEVLLQLTETILPSTVDTGAGGAVVNKIISSLQVCRKECLVISPDSYNELMKKLKELVFGRGLQNSSLWQEIARLSLGLITSDESPRSNFSVSQAEEFLTVQQEVNIEQPAAQQPQENNDGYDDLLDDF